MRPIDEILDDVAEARNVNDADALRRYADELDEHQTPQAEIHATRSRGTVCFLRNEYSSALTYFHRALELSEQHGDRMSVARVTNNIGMLHASNGELAVALEHFHRALVLSVEIGDKAVEYSIVDHIANIHRRTGNLSSALEHYHRALAICEENGDLNGIAGATCNIGLALSGIDDYPAALEHLYRSLSLSTELGNTQFAANALVNIGVIFDSTGDYVTALTKYDTAVAMYEEIGDTSGLAIAATCIGCTHQNIGDLHTALDYHRRAMTMHQELGNVQAATNDFCNVILVLLDQGSYDEARAHLETMDTIQVDDPVLRIWREQCRARIQDSSGDHDSAVATLHHALSEANDHGLRSKAADVHKALRDLAQKRNDLAGYIEHNNKYTRISEEINGKDTAAKLATQEAERRIASERQEHQKHLAILHSTLPRHIADRVARGETVNDHYDSASVIFLDIAGFTALSEQLSSAEVVKLLETVFTALDAVCKNHDVGKIKTIGDSYMAVAFPSESSSSEQRAAKASIDMLNAISHIRTPTSSPASFPEGSPIQVRIGMHCGPVTAGVIGTERMQYDVWGDTVNVASRMESTGEPGRIHVSDAFAEILRSDADYAPYTITQRGMVEIKGKGTMQTYWLE